MEIRRLTISDYEQMVALWQRAGLPYRPEGRDQKEAVRVQMKTNPDFFLGAFKADALIGVSIVTCDGRKGWINRLAVDPEYSRRGIAKTLIAESENVLRKHGMKIFCALIEDDNSSSMQLFKKCHYVEHRDIVYLSKRDDPNV